MSVRRAYVDSCVPPIRFGLSKMAVPPFESIRFLYAFHVLLGAVAGGDLGGDSHDPRLQLTQGDRRRRPRGRRHVQQEALLVAAGLLRCTRGRRWQPQPVILAGYAVLIVITDDRIISLVRPGQVVTLRLLGTRNGRQAERYYLSWADR